MEYLADRIVVHLRSESSPLARRATLKVDVHGHVEIRPPLGLFHAREFTTEWLVEENVIESHQVDAGPSFEWFLTDEWQRQLAPQLKTLSGWVSV